MPGLGADGPVGGEVVEGGEGDVVFGGEGGEAEVGVEDAGGGVVFAGLGLVIEWVGGLEGGAGWGEAHRVGKKGGGLLGFGPGF